MISTRAGLGVRPRSRAASRLQDGIKGTDGVRVEKRPPNFIDGRDERSTA